MQIDSQTEDDALRFQLPEIARYFRCDVCRSPLEPARGELRCGDCGRSVSDAEGVIRFVPNGSYHGEFTPQEMSRFVADAREHGWEHVLRTQMYAREPHVVGLLTDSRRSAFTSLVGGIEGGVALDLGCGLGGISMQIRDRFRWVFALDHTAERLEFLSEALRQERIDNVVPICHEDVRALPFADSQFDLVYLVGVLEYFPGTYPEMDTTQVQIESLEEVFRILKPNGKLYVGTKNRYGWHYFLGARDNSGLKFGPVLPRWLARAANRILFGKSYNVVVESLPGYTRILERSGFGKAEFFWAYPGYQSPDRHVPLGDGAVVEPGLADGKWYSSAMRVLARVGALKYVVPHYGIVATKPPSSRS